MNIQVSSIQGLIKNKRENLGLNQREFAEFIGLKEGGERTVGSWERGEHIPSSSKLFQIENLNSNVPFKDRNSNHKFDFIDLFAGIGGIRLPFQNLKGRCVFTSEWDKFAKKTYAANFGELPQGDITKITSSNIPSHDVLLAGFPCQAFSQAGLKKGFYDTRGTMFFEIQRILAYHQPKAFLLENVKQLKGHDKGNTLDTILKILRGNKISDIPSNIPMSQEAKESLSTVLDYNVEYRVLKASEFGVPQNRERIYIVGFNKQKVPEANQRNLAAELFDKLESYKKRSPLSNILEDNKTVHPKYTISDRLWAGHQRRKKEHKAKGNGFGYSLFDKNSIACNTISARYYKDGSEILIDQNDIGKNPRKLTPRECARIQGFPEKFNIHAVSDVQNYRQFGNSVSVPVIKAIANEITSIITD